jgi:hypothetical protein
MKQRQRPGCASPPSGNRPKGAPCGAPIFIGTGLASAVSAFELLVIVHALAATLWMGGLNQESQRGRAREDCEPTERCCSGGALSGACSRWFCHSAFGTLILTALQRLSRQRSRGCFSPRPGRQNSATWERERAARWRRHTGDWPDPPFGNRGTALDGCDMDRPKVKNRTSHTRLHTSTTTVDVLCWPAGAQNPAWECHVACRQPP